MLMAEGRCTPPPTRRFSFTPPVSPTKVDALPTVFPPLVNSTAEGKMPFIIGVTGGTASGKTSVCRKIMEALGQNDLSSTERRVAIVNQDCFYRDLDEEQREIAAKGEYNFDHPDAFDNELMKHSVHDLLMGKEVDLPVYDFKTHTRSRTEKKTVYQADVILLEGILVLYDSEIRDMMAVKLFVDTDSDTRLARRVQRDIQERGRTLDSVLEQYTKYVKPAFEEFTLPTKKYADVIIPRGAMNDVAINLIVQHIKNILEGKIKTRASPRTTHRRTKALSESSCSTRPH